MKPGMVFTIEPCISEGDRRVRTLEDGWTAVTLVSCVSLKMFVCHHRKLFRITAEQRRWSTLS